MQLFCYINDVEAALKLYGGFMHTRGQMMVQALKTHSSSYTVNACVIEQEHNLYWCIYMPLDEQPLQLSSHVESLNMLVDFSQYDYQQLCNIVKCRGFIIEETTDATQGGQLELPLVASPQAFIWPNSNGELQGEEQEGWEADEEPQDAMDFSMPLVEEFKVHLVAVEVSMTLNCRFTMPKAKMR